MKNKLLPVLVIALMAVLLIAGCGSQEANNATGDQNKTTETGNLEIYYNCKESPSDGITTKDGWNLKFDHIYMTLSDIKAYQTDPPFSPGGDVKFNAVEEVGFDGVYNIDLAQGKLPALAAVKNVPIGHYNSISWNNIKAKDGEAAGYSIVLIGNAAKDGKEINFNINLDPEFKYLGGEYVGDVRKGIVQAGTTADLEITYHLDHVFGDSSLPADNKINALRSVGFDLFAAFAKDGEINVDMAQLKKALSSEEYKKLEDSLMTLGHVGGGPCQKEKL